MDTRTTTLLNLPADTLNREVANDNLDTHSVINLSLANKYTYKLFKPTLLQRLKKYIERSAKKQVEILLKIHPNFDSSYLSDICQTALWLGDINLFKAITKRREDILNRIEIPKKLFNEKNTYDLTAVVAAIESGKNVEEELIQFRTDLDKIIKEKGFPFQALLNAYVIHEEKNNSWTDKQCELFTVKVIGYFQRLSPAWLKKALVTGIRNITESGWACGDTFVLQSGDSIDPTLDAPNSGLGFDFSLDAFGDTGVGVRLRIVAALHQGMSQFLKKYLEQKQQTLMSLGSNTQNQKQAHIRLLK